MDRVPSADGQSNRTTNQVIGNKNDAAVTTVGVTASIIAYVKGLLGLHVVPTADATTDAFMRDVVGRKTDAAVTAVGTTKTLMAYLKGLIGLHGVPTADASTNTFMRDVVGIKTDAAVTAVGTVASIMAYVKGLVAPIGSQFALSIAVTSSAIPNNTQTAGAITDAASAAMLIEDIIFETDNTGVAGPTNLELTTDNAKGLTGAAAPNILQAVSGLGANKSVVARVTSTTKVLPFVLESGKKLYLDGDDGAGTGAGVLRITLVGRRLAAGASLAAGGIGT